MASLSTSSSSLSGAGAASTAVAAPRPHAPEELPFALTSTSHHQCPHNPHVPLGSSAASSTAASTPSTTGAASTSSSYATLSTAASSAAHGPSVGGGIVTVAGGAGKSLYEHLHANYYRSYHAPGGAVADDGTSSQPSAAPAHSLHPPSHRDTGRGAVIAAAPPPPVRADEEGPNDAGGCGEEDEWTVCESDCREEMSGDSYDDGSGRIGSSGDFSSGYGSGVGPHHRGGRHPSASADAAFGHGRVAAETGPSWKQPHHPRQHEEQRRGGSEDVLGLLVQTLLRDGDGCDAASNGDGQQGNSDSEGTASSFELAAQCEEANDLARTAADAARRGDLAGSVADRTKSAKLFRDAAIRVRGSNPSLAHSLLLLSRSQARSAAALQEVIEKHPNDSCAPTPSAGDKGPSSSQRSTGETKMTKDASVPSSPPSLGGPADRQGADGVDGAHAQSAPPFKGNKTVHDRLRAKVRGALDTRPEADMTDSTFLGTKKSPSPLSGTSPRGGVDVTAPTVETPKDGTGSDATDSTAHGQSRTSSADKGRVENNPIDDMMALERELRDMDMALEMGNSVASLGSRAPSRTKNPSTDDGSFCVLPPGSSYMSSSMWVSGVGVGGRPQHEGKSVGTGMPVTGTTAVRARANRVQTLLDASTASPPRKTVADHQSHTLPAALKPSGNHNLDSSWWGHPIGASHLASSTVSIGSKGSGGHNAPANTKQLVRLLDSLKTLGDENASLLRELDEARTAQVEAKTARDEMKKFKAEYQERFAKVKEALEKFTKKYPENGGNADNPVTTSEFVRSSSATELRKKDQMIKKLAADLRKERDDGRKKDAALRKYESFYREVKARSAQKALQRQREQQQHSQKQKDKIHSKRAMP